MTQEKNKQKIAHKFLAKHWQAASYDPKLNWNLMAQPDVTLTAEDYVDIAEQVNDTVEFNVKQFCEEHGFSTIMVDEKAFTDYEEGTYTTAKGKKGALTFREFLNDYAQKTNQAINVDLMTLSSCVKGLRSAERKIVENNEQPRNIIDYSRTMFVALKGKARATKDTKSLKTLGRLMQSMEDNSKTRARKNYFWEPHEKTGFRAYKALWLSTVPSHKARSGQQVLTEVKIEHESQMELDRATRPFLNIGRDTKRLTQKLTYGFENVVRDWGYEDGCAEKAIKDNMRHTKNAGEVLKWGKWLYARANQDAGLNIFRKPNLSHTEKQEYSAPSYAKIINEIKRAKGVSQKGVVRSVVTALVAAKVVPEKEVRALERHL